MKIFYPGYYLFLETSVDLFGRFPSYDIFDIHGIYGENELQQY
jgi:hypothetical protein